MNRTDIMVVALAVVIFATGALTVIPDGSYAIGQDGYIEVIVSDEGTTTEYAETYPTLSAAFAAVQNTLDDGVPESLELHIYGTVSTGETNTVNGPYNSFQLPSKYLYNSYVFISDVSIVGHGDATVVSEYENVELSGRTTGVYQESRDSETRVINEGSVTITGVDFTMNLRLLFEHANNQYVGTEDNAEQSSNLTTVSGCGFQGTLYTLTNWNVGSNSAVVTDCTFSGENVGANGYAYFAQGKFSSVDFENNTVSNYPRGINVDLNNEMVSEVNIRDNSITYIYGITGEGWNSAIQFTCADSIRVDGNTISNVAYNVFAVYPRDSSTTLRDYLGAVIITNNHITDSTCLLSNITEGFDSISVFDNRISDEVDLVNGFDRSLAIQSNGITVSESENQIETDLPPIIWDNDDEYIPPIVPVQPEQDSGDDDTTTIVACAAAAVVAALIAAYLIIDRRH